MAIPPTTAPCSDPEGWTDYNRRCLAEEQAASTTTQHEHDVTDLLERAARLDQRQLAGFAADVDGVLAERFLPMDPAVAFRGCLRGLSTEQLEKIRTSLQARRARAGSKADAQSVMASIWEGVGG